MGKRPIRSCLQAYQMICIILYLFTVCTNCKYYIRPSAFQIYSLRSGMSQISFDLQYSGSNGKLSLSFPDSALTQCPNGGIIAYCYFQIGRKTLIPNAGEMVISDNDSFSQLNFNVRERSELPSNLSIDSKEWKLSPNQCTPYEVGISLDYLGLNPNQYCYSINDELFKGAQVTEKVLKNVSEAAKANVKAEFGKTWSNCSSWLRYFNSYALYANVAINSAYPAISPVITVCTSQRIAIKDGYGNYVFPYNTANVSLPDWITFDENSYIAKPLATTPAGDYPLTLGVFGPCGAKNLTTNLKVKPEAQYNDQTFVVYACLRRKLQIKDTNGNVALPSQLGASLNWIIHTKQSYFATATQKELGNYTATLKVVSPCADKSVNALIVVNPEKAYSDVSFTIKACSTVRLIVNDTYGEPVRPSTSPTSSYDWLQNDAEGYFAKPTTQNIGFFNNITLSMHSQCGPRNVTATIRITNSEDFVVKKKIINALNTDPASTESLSFEPSNKVVSCQNFQSNNSTYDWFSITKSGVISLNPSGVQSEQYSFKGFCTDECSNSIESVVLVKISNLNYANFLSSTGIALAAVVFAMLF